MKIVEKIIIIAGKHQLRKYPLMAGITVLSLLGYLAAPVVAGKQLQIARIALPPDLRFSHTFPQIPTPDQQKLLTLNDAAESGIGMARTSDWQDVEVKSGDTLSSIFGKVGLTDQEMYNVMNSSAEAKTLNRLYPGYQLSFHIPDGGKLEQLRIFKSPLEGFLFTRVDDLYDVETIIRTPEIHPVFKHGTIFNSLFMAGQQEAIPDVLLMEMANIFGGVIDFALDPRVGDEFSLLFEEKYLDGEYVGNGEILAAQFTNRGKQFIAVRYENEEGKVGFYNPQGESMRKAFLRTPLDVFKITSNFNLARRHPIMNTIRAHKGTDYAAPTGTPVYATSDGTVTWAARNGSFGKLIVIKHEGAFETKYAHLSDYAKGIKKGSRVRQGDIIGYVGTTGSSTGPHLHYEFLVNGKHQNPRTVLDQLPKAVSLAAEELPRFLTQSEELLSSFSDLSAARLLTLNQQGAD